MSDEGPRFYVIKHMARGYLWMYRDAKGELGFTHVKAHASKFTEDEADLAALNFNRWMAWPEASVIGAGKSHD